MADEQSGDLTYDIPAAVQGQTAIDPQTYQQMYERSVRDPGRILGGTGRKTA